MEYTKIVYNNCYGGFSLSDSGVRMYLQLKGWKYTEEVSRFSYTNFIVEGVEGFYDRDIDRADPCLVEAVEKLGVDANGDYAKLCIANVPKGTLYRITDYDGLESVETRDAFDWKVA